MRSGSACPRIPLPGARVTIPGQDQPAGRAQRGARTGEDTETGHGDGSVSCRDTWKLDWLLSRPSLRTVFVSKCTGLGGRYPPAPPPPPWFLSPPLFVFSSLDWLLTPGDEIELFPSATKTAGCASAAICTFMFAHILVYFYLCSIFTVG